MYMDTSVNFIETTPDPADLTTISRQQNHFLFITNDIDESNPLLHLYNSYLVNGFPDAKNVLKEKADLLELIVIDIPLNHVALVEFKVWLVVHQLNGIPIIYHEKALNKDEVPLLFLQKLVDDVVDLPANINRLPYKARFLKKIRPGNQVNKLSKGSVKADGRCSSFTRCLDFLVALTAIIILIPFFILIAIAVKLESRGPVFYSATRAGRGFKIFKFYKFRTMITGADQQIQQLQELNLYADEACKARFFKIKDDPRITRVGSFLRNSSLDELPQLFNVLKGDMNLVGNRPLPLYEATTLTTNEWAERFMAPAGITGLWQISKRGKAEMSNEERILLDIDYARNRSLLGDLKILMQTPVALMQKTNV